MIPLVIIPARGGSKGLPGKNIKELDGRPLILYTVDAARKIFSDNAIIVSTDDAKIRDCVEASGLHVPFLRPSYLADDQAKTSDVILHSMNFSEDNGYYPDVIIVLQPTSPLRKSHHITSALKEFTTELDMVVSVKETKANPYYVLKEEDEQGFLIKSKEGIFTRRQDCPPVWELNGAIYVINSSSFKNDPVMNFKRVKKFVMDEYSSIDIDTLLDFMTAELILKLKSV